MLGFGLIDRDRVAAAQAAKAALDLDPDNVLALRVLVRVAFLEEQAEPLLNLGTRLTELAPGQPWGALAFGAYHVVRGEKGLAGPWLRRVEAGADRFTLATAAVLWSAAGRWSDAERLFRRLRAGDPGDVTAAIGLAMALKARRDFIGAEAALAEAAQADPSRAAVWLQFADLYARTARKIEAERAASAARRLEADETLVADAIAGRLGAQDRRAV
jgi:predicted Zn-dependent protease